MKTEKDPARPVPMSLRLPCELRNDLAKTAELLGEREATVARMSIRYGLRALLKEMAEKKEAAA